MKGFGVKLYEGIHFPNSVQIPQGFVPWIASHIILLYTLTKGFSPGRSRGLQVFLGLSLS